MPQIFISYSRADRQFVDEFVTLMRKVYGNDSVWFDDDIYGGTDWWQKILSEVGRCDLFVYLASNDSLTSEYCQAEFREALRLNKKFLPVIVRPKTAYPGPVPADLKAELERTQFVDISRGFKDYTAVTNLYAAANRLLANIPAQTPPPVTTAPTPQPEVTQTKKPSRRLAGPIMIGAVLIALLLLVIVVLPRVITPPASSETPTAETQVVALATEEPSATFTETIAPTATPTLTPVPVTQTPEPTPVIVPTTDTTATVEGPCTARIMNKGGANLRPGPTASNEVLRRVNYRETVNVLDRRPDANTSATYAWIKVEDQSGQGWMREDNAALYGDCRAFGVPADLYDAPLQNYHWSMGFDPEGVSGIVSYGWSLAGDIGESVYVTGSPGTVLDVMYCIQCGDEGFSSFDKGFSLGDSRVLNDPDWNYGYGHYITVKYASSQLPVSTQQYLAEQNWPGRSVSCRYSHLSKILVEQNQVLQQGAVIGELGNSGASTGPHLQLECRVADASEDWSDAPRVSIPGRLFSRAPYNGVG